MLTAPCLKVVCAPRCLGSDGCTAGRKEGAFLADVPLPSHVDSQARDQDPVGSHASCQGREGAPVALSCLPSGVKGKEGW